MSATNEIDPNEWAVGLKYLHAYTECSDEIQEGIREMLSIVSSPEADADDRAMAMHTLADALYPRLFDGLLGLDLEQSEGMGATHSEETRTAIAELDEQESIFAQRLSAIMEDRGMTQVKLAELSGVGQPAISNMLKRQCRPQRRTIKKFAEALGVSPESLWPGFSGE
jgi:lambda repressor-like predicted transcriptional regulator